MPVTPCISYQSQTRAIPARLSPSPAPRRPAAAVSMSTQPEQPRLRAESCRARPVTAAATASAGVWRGGGADVAGLAAVDVAISGGGPAGLAVAHALLRACPDKNIKASGSEGA